MIADRIREFVRVPASSLIHNPKNWRTHPPGQSAAMRAMLESIGYANALLARDTPDGLLLIDGHLRAEITPDEQVPVLVLDVTEQEADALLASLDPLSAMAGVDHEQLVNLLQAAPLPDAPGVEALIAHLTAISTDWDSFKRELKDADVPDGRAKIVVLAPAEIKEPLVEAIGGLLIDYPGAVLA